MKRRILRHGKVVRVERSVSAPVLRMNLLDRPAPTGKEAVVSRLRALNRRASSPAVRQAKVEVLLSFIGDEEVRAAYDGLPVWKGEG